jgi:hypothetical protein
MEAVSGENAAGIGITDSDAMRKGEIPAKAFAWAAAWTQLDMNSLSVSWEPPVIRSASRCFRDYDPRWLVRLSYRHVRRWRGCVKSIKGITWNRLVAMASSKSTCFFRPGTGAAWAAEPGRTPNP